MKKLRYTESQIVNILKQNKSGVTVAEPLFYYRIFYFRMVWFFGGIANRTNS
jgi:hypothetical protein